MIPHRRNGFDPRPENLPLGVLAGVLHHCGDVSVGLPQAPLSGRLCPGGLPVPPAAGFCGQPGRALDALAGAGLRLLPVVRSEVPCCGALDCAGLADPFHGRDRGQPHPRVGVQLRLLQLVACGQAYGLAQRLAEHCADAFGVAGLSRVAQVALTFP